MRYDMQAAVYNALMYPQVRSGTRMPAATAIAASQVPTPQCHQAVRRWDVVCRTTPFISTHGGHFSLAITPLPFSVAELVVGLVLLLLSTVRDRRASCSSRRLT